MGIVKAPKSEKKIITHEQIQDAIQKWDGHGASGTIIVELLREIGEGLRTGDLSLISRVDRKRAVAALEAAAEMKSYNKSGSKSRKMEALKLLQLYDG